MTVAMAPARDVARAREWGREMNFRATIRDPPVASACLRATSWVCDLKVDLNP